MKYTLKIQLKNGGEISSEPFELAWEPEQVNIEAQQKELPKRWVELGVAMSGYSITELDSKLRICSNLVANDDNRNLFATEAQAKSALAYAQLTQLMKAYNGHWEPDWEDESTKFIIDRSGNAIVIKQYASYFCFLSFPTEVLRDEFYKNFEPLIKVFYQIQED